MGKRKKGRRRKKGGKKGFSWGKIKKKTPIFSIVGREGGEEGKKKGGKEERERRGGEKEVENGDGYRSWGGRWRKKGGVEVWKGSDWGRSGGGKIIIIIIKKGSFGEKGEKGVENGDGYRSWGGR